MVTSVPFFLKTVGPVVDNCLTVSGVVDIISQTT